MQRHLTPNLLPLLALALAALSGCAAQETVALERGGTLVTLGAAATDASRELLREVRRANEEARIEIVVADPSCNFRDIRIASDDAPADAILCSPGGVPFAEVKAGAVEPTIRLIDGVTAYLSAVDDVLGGTSFDSAAAVEQALVDANAIATIATTGEAGPFSADQIAAASGLAAVLARVADTRARADRLAVLETEHPAVGPLIDVLDRDTRTWAGSSLPANLKAIDAAFETRSLQLRQAMVAERKAGGSLAADAQWRAFLQSWSQIRARQEGAEALPREMGRVVGSLRKAHAGYARLLDPNAKLTAADRAAIRATARRQLSEVLASVAGVLRAFL
jgi:hypothetical protein